MRPNNKGPAHASLRPCVLAYARPCVPCVSCATSSIEQTRRPPSCSCLEMPEEVATWLLMLQNGEKHGGIHHHLLSLMPLASSAYHSNMVCYQPTRFAPHLTSPHLTSPHLTSHQITSHHITSHHITSHHITSHHITSRPHKRVSLSSSLPPVALSSPTLINYLLQGCSAGEATYCVRANAKLSDVCTSNTTGPIL